MSPNPEANARNWIHFLSEFVRLLKLFGPALLHQLQEPCGPSRSLPRPTRLQARTGQLGLSGAEQAFLPPSIGHSFSPAFSHPSFRFPLAKTTFSCCSPQSPPAAFTDSQIHLMDSQTKLGLKSHLPSKAEAAVGSEQVAQDFAQLHLDNLQSWRSYRLSRLLFKHMAVPVGKKFPMLQARSLSLIFPCTSIKSLALSSQYSPHSCWGISPQSHLLTRLDKPSSSSLSLPGSSSSPCPC